jgi:hypothetical protein
MQSVDDLEVRVLYDRKPLALKHSRGREGENCLSFANATARDFLVWVVKVLKQRRIQLQESFHVKLVVMNTKVMPGKSAGP